MTRHNDKGRRRGKTKQAKIMEKALKKMPTKEEIKLVVEEVPDTRDHRGARQRRTEDRIAYRKTLREALAEGWRL